MFRITCYLRSVHEFDRYGYMLHALSKNTRPLLYIQYVVCNQLKYGNLRVSRWVTCVARDWSRFSEKGGTTILHKRSPITTLVVIGTDCIGSCKSNYHKITITTGPQSDFWARMVPLDLSNISTLFLLYLGWNDKF